MISLTTPQWECLAKAAAGGFEYDGYFTKATEKLFMLDLVYHVKRGEKKYLVATDKGRAALKQ